MLVPQVQLLGQVPCRQKAAPLIQFGAVPAGSVTGSPYVAVSASSGFVPVSPASSPSAGAASGGVPRRRRPRTLAVVMTRLFHAKSDDQLSEERGRKNGDPSEYLEL